MAHPIASPRESLLNTLLFPARQQGRGGTTLHLKSKALHDITASEPGQLWTFRPGPSFFHPTGIACQHLHPHFHSYIPSSKLSYVASPRTKQ